MAAKSTIKRTEEATLLAQAEGSIASRLRSRFKGVVSKLIPKNDKPNTQEETTKQPRSVKSIQAEKCIDQKKRRESKSKTVKIENSNATTSKAPQSPRITKAGDPSSEKKIQELKERAKIINNGAGGDVPSSHVVEPRGVHLAHTGQSIHNLYGIEPSLDHQHVAWERFANQRPVHHIRWTGFEESGPLYYDCELCQKDMSCEGASEEDLYEYSSQEDEENVMQYSLYTHAREELNYVLPEAAVLPCSHVFHTTCLSALQPAAANLSDPPCPICL